MKFWKFLIAAVLFVTLACSNEDNFEPNDTEQSELFTTTEGSRGNINNGTLQQKLDYKRDNLKYLGDWLVSNINLAQTLADNNNTSNSDYYTMSVSYIIDNSTDRNDAGLKSALDAFLNLDGEDWYPTVTFIEPKGAPTGQITVAIPNYVNNREVYQGFEKDSRNDLVLVHNELDQTNHESNELLMMEISQCGSIGINPGPDEFLNCDALANSDPLGGGSGGHKIRINKMTVKDRKEWWPGRSKVHLIGAKVTGLPLDSGYCGENIVGGGNCLNESGKRIQRMRRRDRGDEKTLNYIVKQDPSSSNPDDYIFYRIFEHDSWPAPIKGELSDFNAHFYFPNQEYRMIEYRSWNSEYDRQILSQTYNNPYNIPFSNTFSTDNSDIKYNLTRGI
ncbi:MAG: hypothetical protein AAF688_13005 [Bacteroidota bacterium]